MQAAMQFPTPSSTGSVEAEINGMCIENTSRGNIKSCWIIKWRDDSGGQLAAGYYFQLYLQEVSFLIGDQDPIVIDPTNPDTPNLATYNHIRSPFKGLFGDWVVKEPIVDNDTGLTRVLAYRHLPLPGWEHPRWLDSNMQQDVRYEAYDTCKVYTYYQTGDIAANADGPYEEPAWFEDQRYTDHGSILLQGASEGYCLAMIWIIAYSLF